MSHVSHRDELRGEDGAPQTPWIWNPPGLISTEADSGFITADLRDDQGHRIGQEPRGPTPSRQSSFDRVPELSSVSSVYPLPDRHGSNEQSNGPSSVYAHHPRNDTHNAHNTHNTHSAHTHTHTHPHPHPHAHPHTHTPPR